MRLGQLRILTYNIFNVIFNGKVKHLAMLMYGKEEV
jgi:hypothetical protein